MQKTLLAPGYHRGERRIVTCDDEMMTALYRDPDRCQKVHALGSLNLGGTGGEALQDDIRLLIPPG